MATTAAPIVHAGAVDPQPVLEPGDRLSRDEFERRYERMPQVRKAELVEGTVYMPSPVRARKHGKPHMHLSHWLASYELETPGVEGFDRRRRGAQLLLLGDHFLDRRKDVFHRGFA